MNKTNKILFITLSNIGDAILTLPALDALIANFPKGKITVVCGPRPKELFMHNPYVSKLIIFDKHSRMREKIRLFRQLKKEKFDLVIDLRNSLFGVMLAPLSRIQPRLVLLQNKKHMQDSHLCKTQVKAGLKSPKISFCINEQDKAYARRMLSESGIAEHDKLIVIAAGARSHIKRWPQHKFVELIPSLIEEFRAKVVLAGDKDDSAVNKYIASQLKQPVLDLSGKTTLSQMAALLSVADLLITNDSATMHLASYLNLPVVAIFGPTNELKYGPWSENSAVVKKDIHCRPCEKAQCRFGTLRCMEVIQPEDVLNQVRKILDQRPKTADQRPKEEFKRILVVRTDRIGDVVLSTPVIKALRVSYPQAFIAMMVSPYAKDILDGNPYLDEVITFDKDRKEKSWWGCFKFSHFLKKKKFDLAIVLHPTQRVHLVIFHSGIPKRVGYNNKYGFLLTDKFEHTKQRGEKHELEYNLDLIERLGIEPKDKLPFVAIKPESEQWVEELFEKETIRKADKLLAINPGASCPSKIWPAERFAEAADKLVAIFGFKVLVVSGSRETALAENVIRYMHNKPVNLAGRTSVSQLASILKRCRLFISNDSGPVHIATAVGVPVISIFGRAQAGLGPKRWGPVGEKGRILHKTVGCVECLAHNCTKGFLCLKAITVDDVLSLATSIMEEA